MLNAIWTRMFGFGRWIYQAAPWTTFFCGVGAGWVLLALFQQYLSQLGTSSPVISAAWCVTGLAWAIAWGRFKVEPASQSSAVLASGTWRRLIGPGVLMLIVSAGPWIWMLHDFLLTDASLGAFWMLFLYASVWASVMLAIPVWCVARLALDVNGSNAKSSTSPESSAAIALIPSSIFVFSVAVGIAACPSLSFGNVYFASVLASLLALGARAAIPAENVLVAVPEPGASRTAEPISIVSALPKWELASVALACGGLLVWHSNVIGLLLVPTIFSFAAIVAGTLAGVAIGFRFAVSPEGLLNRCRFWGSYGLIVTTLTMTAGFSLVVYQMVTLTGSVSQVWLLQGIRDLFVAMLTIPIGFVWALSCTSGLRVSRFVHLSQLGTGVTWALIGGVLIFGYAIPMLGLSATSYVLLFWIAAIAIRDVFSNQGFPRGVLSRGALAACGLVLVLAPFFGQGVRPEFASRLLFSSNVYLADRSGIPRGQLPFLDDCRVNQVQLSEHGVISVWKSAVSRFQVRENGIPRGVVSTNGAISPQSSPEILISLLPLALHEDPRHVAVLGAGAGVPMYTCMASPDLGVTLVESDSNLISVLKQIVAKSELAAFWKDERLNHVQVDPALWMNSRGQQFDVVISNPDQSTLLKSVSSYTQDFYRRASRRLTADGIFCQRFAHHDFGPEPIQSLSATLRSVFSSVMAVEIGPGEMAFLATNSPLGLIRSDVPERMQAIYASQAMASIGWDWSVMLTLGAYDAEHLDKIQDLGHPHINTASNGWFCTKLPPELMRWGPKPTEISQVLAKNSGKILNWLGNVSKREELLRRLSEVRCQQDLLSNYPDQYWAYRPQIRKQVSTRPLSLIEKVKHEEGRGGLPPEDKRRLRYFTQLSKAIHSKSQEEIQRLELYTNPYDPLVSLFVHQELAEIAARTPGCDPQMELEHRLHTLFFTSTNDRSVRNGLSALRLALDKPESAPAGVDRFDLLNTLLQSLQYRWEARSTAITGNPKELARDVEDNIVLAERALIALTDLAPTSGISASDCEARKHVIERKLLQPLRSYRTRLEPHITRQKMKMEKEVITNGDLPNEEELQFPGADKD